MHATWPLVALSLAVGGCANAGARQPVDTPSAERAWCVTLRYEPADPLATFPPALVLHPALPSRPRTGVAHWHDALPPGRIVASGTWVWTPQLGTVEAGDASAAQAAVGGEPGYVVVFPADTVRPSSDAFLLMFTARDGSVRGAAGAPRHRADTEPLLTRPFAGVQRECDAGPPDGRTAADP